MVKAAVVISNNWLVVYVDQICVIVNMVVMSVARSRGEQLTLVSVCFEGSEKLVLETAQ